MYGEPNAAESIATLLPRAIELSVDFWDTSDMYGTGHNEELGLSGRGFRRSRAP